MIYGARSFLRSHREEELALLNKLGYPNEKWLTWEPMVEEIQVPGGVIMNDDGIKVTAVETAHAIGDDAYSFAYRVDSKHGSVVISGDAAPDIRVVNLAKNADILLHEMTHPDPEMAPDLFKSMSMRHVRLGDSLNDYKEKLPNGHSTPTEVGKIAAMAKVNKLVIYHTTFGRNGSLKEEFLASVRKHYDGVVIPGKPLMIFEVGTDF
jgi:ribonuclease BN (tRNA processing enzyme)